MDIMCKNYVAIFTAAVFLFVGCQGNRLLELETVDDYLNVCMDGISHKLKPGPEGDLFQQCSPWSKRSCCTAEIAEQLHVNSTWYKMDWNHCPQKLSSGCRGRFLQDLCFYECSPNVGPWLVKETRTATRAQMCSKISEIECFTLELAALEQDSHKDGMKIRSERFVDVPLCQQECDAWWDDCKDDYTCIENWTRGFNWSNGFPQCPAGSSCKPMKEIYSNASHFCETVWDHSWKVVDNDDPGGCMVMWWNKGDDNPNSKVAYQRAQQIVSASSRISLLYCLHFVSTLLVFSLHLISVL